MTSLVRLVPDQSDDHAIQVEEEHQEVEAQLDKGFLKHILEQFSIRPYGC